jgi:hypothetical protein
MWPTKEVDGGFVGLLYLPTTDHITALGLGTPSPPLTPSEAGAVVWTDGTGAPIRAAVGLYPGDGLVTPDGFAASGAAAGISQLPPDGGAFVVENGDGGTEAAVLTFLDDATTVINHGAYPPVSLGDGLLLVDGEPYVLGRSPEEGGQIQLPQACPNLAAADMRTVAVPAGTSSPTWMACDSPVSIHPSPTGFRVFHPIDSDMVLHIELLSPSFVLMEVNDVLLPTPLSDAHPPLRSIGVASPRAILGLTGAPAEGFRGYFLALSAGNPQDAVSFPFCADDSDLCAGVTSGWFTDVVEHNGAIYVSLSVRRGPDQPGCLLSPFSADDSPDLYEMHVYRYSG